MVHTCIAHKYHCQLYLVFSTTDTPVYKFTVRCEQFSMEQLAKIIILEDVDEGLICKRQPTGVCKNSTFVVNLHLLEDPCDIRADDNGSGFVRALLSLMSAFMIRMVHRRSTSETS